MTKIEFGYSWDDSDLLGEFWMMCPKCGTKFETDVQGIFEKDDPIICEKCHSKFWIRRKTWIEQIVSSEVIEEKKK